MTSPSGDPGLDTPLAPLPDPAEAAPAPTPRRKRKRVARSFEPGGLWDGLRAGLRYAWSARWVLLMVVGFQILLALTLVMPFRAAVGKHFDHHAHAPALAGTPDAFDETSDVPGARDGGPLREPGLDGALWGDVKRAEKSLFESLGVTFFWIVLIAWLFGAVVAGGFLGTSLEPQQRVKVGRFLTLGGRNFGRMLRVGVVFAVAYYLVGRIVIEMWGGSVTSDEFMASSEASGWLGARLREAVVVVLFLWFRVAADLARADLVVYSRRSALLAFLRGLGAALRPRIVGLAICLGAPAFAILLGLGLATDLLEGDSTLLLVALFLVIQLAVLVRWTSRAALLTGLAHQSVARGRGT